MSEINMPDGTHLAYTVYHETYWWKQLRPESRPNEGLRCVQVAASAQGEGGGVAWEFGVVEHILGSRPALQLCIFDDAWMAFANVAPFFTALTDDTVKEIDDVIGLLDELGAVDETER